MTLPAGGQLLHGRLRLVVPRAVKLAPGVWVNHAEKTPPAKVGDRRKGGEAGASKIARARYADTFPPAAVKPPPAYGSLPDTASAQTPLFIPAVQERRHFCRQVVLSAQSADKNVGAPFRVFASNRAGDDAEPRALRRVGRGGQPEALAGGFAFQPLEHAAQSRAIRRDGDRQAVALILLAGHRAELVERDWRRWLRPGIGRVVGCELRLGVNRLTHDQDRDGQSGLTNGEDGCSHGDPEQESPRSQGGQARNSLRPAPFAPPTGNTDFWRTTRADYTAGHQAPHAGSGNGLLPYRNRASCARSSRSFAVRNTR